MPRRFPSVVCLLAVWLVAYGSPNPAAAQGGGLKLPTFAASTAAAADWASTYHALKHYRVRETAAVEAAQPSGAHDGDFHVVPVVLPATGYRLPATGYRLGNEHSPREPAAATVRILRNGSVGSRRSSCAYTAGLR